MSVRSGPGLRSGRSAWRTSTGGGGNGVFLTDLSGAATLPPLTAAATINHGVTISSGAATLPALTAAGTMAYAAPGPPVAGYIHWFDPSDTGTITDAGSGKVSQLNDKSGNGYHATQATDGSRPITGTRTQNGLNVLDFISNDNLSATGPGNAAQPHTYVFVGKNDSAASGTRAAFDALNSGGTQDAGINMRGGVDGTTPTYYLGAGSDTNTGTADTNAHVWVFIFNGASSKIWIDGVLISTTNPGSSNGPGGVRIGDWRGGGAGWDGWIGEFLNYASALSDGDRDSLESYLGTKWGISVT